VETLLAEAISALLYPSLNEIDAEFARRQDRAILGPRSALFDPSEFSDLSIRLSDVRVHWPALVGALATVGCTVITEPAAAPPEQTPTAESSAKTPPVWIPLGIVHNDDYYCREALMRRVQAEFREGRLELRGYHKDERWRESEPIPYPYCLELELDWVAGPSREDGDNPRFPGLKYHCDVSVSHRNNRRDFWTELLIAQANHDRLRTEICEALLREWRNMTVGTAVPDAKHAPADRIAVEIGRSNAAPAKEEPPPGKTIAAALGRGTESSAPIPTDHSADNLPTVPSDSKRVDRERDSAVSVTRIRQHGPKRGTTGFSAAYFALCPDIDKMVKSGKARSAIAAARDLVQQKRVVGKGTEDSLATRVARRFAQWKSKG
jgi:hypothetical protein